MFHHARAGRINVRLLILLVGIVVLGGGAIAAARHYQVRSLAARSRADGLAAYVRGDWPEAVRQMRRSLRRSPDDEEILAKYADANLRLQPAQRVDCLAAAEALYRLVKSNPTDVAKFELLARLRFGLRDFAELERLAGRRLELHADDRAAQLWLARARIGRRSFAAARDTLTQLLALHERDAGANGNYSDEHADALVLLAIAAQQDDARTGATTAMDLLDRAIARRPDHTAARFERARLRVAQLAALSDAAGEAAEARNAIRAAAIEDMNRLAAPDAEMRVTGATIWLALGDPARATAELIAADAQSPETIAESFPITSDWIVARFLAGAQVELHRSPPSADVAWVDAALGRLRTRDERAPVLADAVRILARAGRIESARALLLELDQTRAIQGGRGTDDEIAFLNAVLARAAGDEYSAINILEPLSLRSSAPRGIWALLAEAYSRTGQSRRAAAALTQYLRLAPTDAAAQMSLVREYVRLRDWGRALEVARAAQTSRPGDVELALLRIESTLQVVSQTDAAERNVELDRIRAELDQLSTAEPTRVEIRVLQASLALLQGDATRAEQTLAAAIENCQESLPAQLELIQLYHRAQRRDEAVKTARLAVERHPDRSIAHEVLAELLLTYGDATAAATVLREAAGRLQTGAERRAAELKLALLELQGASRSDGIARLRTLLDGEPRDLRPAVLLLSLPETRGDLAAAQMIVDRIRGVEGDSGLAWRIEQASLWIAGDDWRTHEETAVALLQRCAEADPAWERPALLLGELHERGGRPDLAESAYRRVLTMNPGAAEVADRLLMLLDRAKRVADQQDLLRSLTLPRGMMRDWRLAIAMHARDFTEAADVLRLRIANDAGDASARVLMARLVHQQSGDVERALAYLDEAESIAGDRTAIVATRAAILEASGRVEDAIRLLTERVERRRDFESLWMRGAFLLRVGRLDAAETDYTALPSIATDARGHEMLGALRAQQGRLDDAIDTWSAGLKLYPTASDVARRLARALMQRGAAGDRDRAGELVAELAARLPEDSDVLLLNATWMLLDPAKANVDRGAALLERVVRLNPRATDAYLTLVRLAMDEEAYARAREIAIRALGAAGDDPRLFVARAEAELACGNARLAREMARGLWLKNPADYSALDVFASATAALADETLTRDAIAVLRRTYAVGTIPPRAVLPLARLLAASGATDDAVAELRAVADAAAGAPNVAVLLALAELHARRNEPEPARECIDRAAAVAPDNPAVLQARVLWLGAQHRASDIADAVRAAPAAAREWPQVLIAAGIALAESPREEHRQLAATLFTEALTRLPPRSPLRLDIAGQLFAVGAIDQSESVFREALARDPNNARALNDLAWLLAEGRGQYDEALRLADRGIGIDPDNVELRDTRGHILLHLRVRLEEARIDLQHSADRTPADSPARARALLKLVHACVASRDAEAALRHLGEALRIDKATTALSQSERIDAEALRAKLDRRVE